MRATLGVLTLVLLASIAPYATAHGGNAVGLEARERPCPDSQAKCLVTFNLPVDKQPGDPVEIMVRNFGTSNSSYTIHVTTLDEADPDRQDTPAAAALASIGPVPPGEEREVNVTVPDARELYAWSDADDDEAEGMHEVFAVRPPGSSDGPGSEPAPGPGGGLLALALAGAALLIGKDR